MVSSFKYHITFLNSERQSYTSAFYFFNYKNHLQIKWRTFETTLSERTPVDTQGQQGGAVCMGCRWHKVGEEF